MKKRVLITGSSGMLGAGICTELKKDYEITGLDLAAARFLPAACFRECDITDRKKVSALVSNVDPDAVVHTAAWTDVDGCELDDKKAYKINSQGSKNVAAACKAADAILIYISTDFVFDGKKKEPYKESDRPNPLSAYGDSKLKGEEAVRDILKRYFIIRTSWLYGCHGRNFADTILAKAKTEKALKVVDDQVGSPTYTKDLARAIHALLNKIFTNDERRTMQYGIYHISNSGSVSWYDYARTIIRLSSLRARVIPISSEKLARRAKRPALSVLDNSKFERFTGYRMRGWKEALEEYIEEGRKIA